MYLIIWGNVSRRVGGVSMYLIIWGNVSQGEGGGGGGLYELIVPGIMG